MEKDEAEDEPVGAERDGERGERRGAGRSCGWRSESRKRCRGGGGPRRTSSRSSRETRRSRCRCTPGRGRAGPCRGLRRARRGRPRRPAGAWAGARAGSAQEGEGSGRARAFAAVMVRGWSAVKPSASPVTEPTAKARPCGYSSGIMALCGRAGRLRCAVLALGLAAAAPPLLAADVTVNVDPDADRRPISRGSTASTSGARPQAARLHCPVRRWGGNATTRYSWQDDVSNQASDWFFYNIEDANPNPGDAARRLDRRPLHRRDPRAREAESLLTVPIIGWTPIDRIRRWGFSVAKYGAQQQTECTATGNPSWCNPDAGNGVQPTATARSPATIPHDTSRAIGPSFVTDWMAAHRRRGPGRRGRGGVRFFALDNEPMLWNSTHRDVHPGSPRPTTSSGSARATTPPRSRRRTRRRMILGPATWGWCAYSSRPLDGCGDGRRPRPPTANGPLSRVVPAAGAGHYAAATRRPAGRLPRHPLLPAGQRGRALRRRVGGDLRPAPALAQATLRPDLRRRVVDRPARRCA